MDYKKIHSWNVSPKKAIKIQIALQKHIQICPLTEINFLAAADVSYSQKSHKAFGVVLIFSYPQLNLLKTYHQVKRINYPYLSGLLSFREGPVLLDIFKKIRRKIDLIMFDGHGISHPRFMGLATHIGILLNSPSIGCAKTPLLKYTQPPENKPMHYKIINYKNKKVGFIMRSKANVKPIFVSPGYKTDIKSCLYIIRTCLKRVRIPEPLHQAHQLSMQFKHEKC